MGIGTCLPGTKVCAADGVAYGDCQGEVAPASADDCKTPEDENCDGVINDGCPCDPDRSPGLNLATGICALMA
ncbi:MAG: hypothetical protein WKG00_34050, partial [Polyangiaceae bacterium]